MPKASGSSSALKRNQACKQCRKRKLKCDAQKPHCTTCVRTWTSQCAVPPPVGFAHPPEPTCTYDPVEGLRLAPDTVDDPGERIRLLESQISELKYKLQEAQFEQNQHQHPSSYRHSRLGSTGSAPGGSGIALSPPERLPSPSLYPSPSPPHSQTNIVLPRASLNLSHDANARGSAGYEGTRSSSQIGIKSDPYMDLLFLGWNPELPEPSVLTHLVEIFFRCDPCGSRILHRPSFMASLAFPPSHPEFPHPSLLHAICASASRWTSRDASVSSDGVRRDRFAEFHALKTRSYIDQTMATEGRWVEVWVFAGFQTRVAIPLRLNYPGTHSQAMGGSVSGYLPAPSNVKELELRRRTWWMSLVFDRIVSAGGWLHGIDERDIGTELPLRTVDFESEQPVESNPQDLSSESALILHPVQYTDTFLLLIKACMLFGKVTDYTVRMNLRPPARSKADDLRLTSDFRALDRLVAVEFLGNLPHMFKNCLGVGEMPDGTAIDTDLYLVHLIPHAATITLHSPFINFSTAADQSAARCLDAARSILTAYYLITSTSFSITRLHPFAVTCWYLAAAVQVQLCKRLIETGDRTNEATAWGEINLLRFAMIEYGSQSPIGIRQEKLLHNHMQEILRMTSQAQPLNVGVPLYPFSHAGVFPNNQAEDGNPSDMGAIASGGHIAPLPSPGYEEKNASLEGDAKGINGIWSGATAGIGLHASTSPPFSQSGF